MRTALDDQQQAPPPAPQTPPPVQAAAPKPRKKKTLAEKNAELRRQLAEARARPRGHAYTDEIPIDQGRQVTEEGAGRSEIVQADQSMVDSGYLERIAFMEEPVTIEINPPGGENPVDSYYCAVNGKGAEVLMVDGQWVSIDWLPVSTRMTTKRKYVAVLAGSKITDVRTEILDRDGDRPKNIEKRTTSGTCNFTVIEDRNPRGAAWLSEVRRRHF
jgi:hypothetical protein